MLIVKKYLGWTAFVIALALCLWAVLESSIFQQCVCEQTYQTSQQQIEKGSADLFIAVIASPRITFRCFGHFLDRNESAVTAIATILIAIFTLTLWLSTSRLAELTNDTITLARQEFLASHRPKIVVRRVSPMTDNEGIATGVQYSIHNIGDEVATIVAISEKIWLPASEENLHPTPPYEPARQVRIKINSGDSQSFMYEEAAPNVRNDLAFRFGYMETFNQTLGLSGEGGGSGILFLGYIDYLDAAGKKRQTAFLRRFIFETKRFDPITHPDYEYQD